MSRSLKPFIIPVFLPHSGCPHHCLFCNQTTITDTDEPLSPDDLRRQANQFLKYKSSQRGRVQISFYGGNFLGLPEKQLYILLETAETLVQAGKIDSIRFSTRPDTITVQNLNKLQGFSVTSVEIGVQSLDNTVLKLSRRGHTAEQSREAILHLKQTGYETTAQLMTGLPGDTGRQSLETTEKIIELAPDSVRIYPTVVITGTGLAEQYRHGRYRPQSLPEAITLAKNIYLRLTESGITVIRMGLQPSRELNANQSVLAGPYHPAFGHLVLSEIYFDEITRHMKKKAPGSRTLTITAHPAIISRIRGLNNRNLDRLRSSYGFTRVSIIEDKTMAKSRIICE